MPTSAMINEFKNGGSIISECALCGSKKIQIYETLFNSPLANNLYSDQIESEKAPRYPLGLAQCEECDHVQLSFAVNPDTLFSNYSYKTGFSSTFREHFRKYAETISTLYLNRKSKANCKILDVGCNDGYFLDCFEQLGYVNTYGVDPARNLCDELDKKHSIFNSFFDLEFAKNNELRNCFDVITANNVFAHTRNLGSFASAASYCLKDDGIFVFEVQYLQSLLQDNLFDMIYHEHTSYHHLSPLVKVLPKYNLNVFDAEIVSTHGGSLRVYCSKAKIEPSKSLSNLLKAESNLSSFSQTNAEINQFYGRIHEVIDSFSFKIKNLRENGYLIWGYTAPAKATTWLASLPPDIRQSIKFVIDDSPLKQGMYIPGTSIPIFSATYVQTKLNIDLDLFRTKSLGIIFSWNILDSLLEKLAKGSIGSGEYLAPLPQVRIVTSF